MNLTGGYLGTYNSESNGQIAQTANYLFGFDPVNFDCAGGLGSNTAAIKDADCGVFFGCGSGESRMCGMGEVYEVAKAREAGIPAECVELAKLEFRTKPEPTLRDARRYARIAMRRRGSWLKNAGRAFAIYMRAWIRRRELPIEHSSQH